MANAIYFKGRLSKKGENNPFEKGKFSANPAGSVWFTESIMHFKAIGIFLITLKKRKK